MMESKLRLKGAVVCVVFLLLAIGSVWQFHADLSPLDDLLLPGGARRAHRDLEEGEQTTPGGDPETSSSSEGNPTTMTETNASPNTDTMPNPSSSSNDTSDNPIQPNPNTTTTIPPTTTPATTTPPLPCSERPFPLSQVCTLTLEQQQGYLGPGVVLEELADTFFYTMVLDALAARCGNGTWCLGYDLDKDLILGDSQLYMQYCDLGYCLGDIPDECMTPERRLVISTLRILCDARMRNVSDRCILGIKKMTHVALVDEVVSINGTGPNCAIDNAGECVEGCLEIGQQLRCMWAACSDEMDASSFTHYNQWSWVLQGVMDNSTGVCNQNNTQCPTFSDSTVLNLKVLQHLLYRIQQNGPAVLAGIVTALVVTVAGFGIIFWACAKKVYVLYEYSRDRVEYTEVKSTQEELKQQEEDSDDST